MCPLSKPHQISLDKLPHTLDLHEWADYIELLCLFNPDREVSKADLIERIKKGKEISPATEESADDIEVEPATTNGSEESIPEKNDRMQTRCDDYFRHLSYREKEYGAFYPFSVSTKGDVLTSTNVLDEKHKLYIFLSLAGNLRYFMESLHVFTDDFEIVSLQALKAALPNTAELHLFGKNRLNKGRYSGLLWARIGLLANDIGETVIISENEFYPSDTGDNGLDLVAWFPTGDNLSGRVLIFCQCACSRTEWVQKQHSSSPGAWRQVMTLRSPPLNIVFVPICFRNSQGNWLRSHNIQETVLMDRARILHNLESDYSTFLKLRSYAVVNGLLLLRETLV